MGKSNVEMEDAEKNDQVSRDNIEGSESKVLDTKIEDKREEFPSAATVAGDSNKSVNGGEDLIKLENETENKITGGSEMEDQMKPESKNSEPMDIEGSNGEQINTGSKKEEQSSTEANGKEQISTDANAKEQNSTDANAEEQTSTDANAEQQTSSDANAKEQTSTDANAKEQTSTEANAEGQTSTEANAEEKTAAGGTMDKQSDARNELVEQNTTNDGQSFTKKGVVGGNLVKNVQENPSGDGAAEKLNDTGRGDGDAEAEKPTDTVKEEGDAAAEKPIHTGREDGDGAAEKLNDTGRGGGDAEAERPTDTEMEEGDAAAEKPIDTGREDGDAAAEKPIDTGREDGDAAAEKPKDTEREEGDSIEHVTKKEMANENANTGNDPTENRQFPTELASKKATQNQNAALDKVPKSEDIEMAYATDNNEDKSVNDEPKEQGKKIHLASPVTETLETATKRESDASSLPNQHEAATPSFILRNTSAKAGENSAETNKSVFTQAALTLTAEGDDGTPEEQAAFMKEIESFYREKAMDFKPPKFYGQPLNCLKLWRAVIRLGGYDRVTGAKLWRQVGESFHPPKTCTTVSWTFRIFYEKSLLEYERHKRQSGELQLPVVTAPEASGADSEGNGYQGSGGPGRARRDAAARAMQGWHVQRLFDNGEVGEPVIKDKNLNNMSKQKNVKSIVSLKQKRPNEVEQSGKVARTESSKQLVTSVVDVGPPADWVKINIRQTKDCFEVYALVPGLLREEVRVQSDPAGRLVITGQPEQVDNPWGITPFKKVVSLPARIDPLQTSAVVSLHGRLSVRVPFEKSTA